MMALFINGIFFILYIEYIKNSLRNLQRNNFKWAQIKAKYSNQ